MSGRLSKTDGANILSVLRKHERAEPCFKEPDGTNANLAVIFAIINKEDSCLKIEVSNSTQ